MGSPSSVGVRTVVLLFTLLSASCSTSDPQQASREFVEKGNTHYAAGRYKEAILEYGNAVQRDPSFGEARLKLAQAYVRVQDTQGAYREYIRAADLMPDNEAAQVAAGNMLLVARQFEDAKTRAQKVLKRNPTSVEALVLLGNALAGMKDLGAAVDELEAAARAEPGRGETFTTLGRMEFAGGNVAAAERAFVTATKAAPSAFNAHLALGNFYWAAGRPKDALPALKRANELQPSDPLTTRAYATVLFVTGSADEGARVLRAFIAKGKEVEWAQLQLADYYTQQKQYDNALRTLAGMTAHEKYGTAAIARLAVLNHALGHRTEAYKILDDALGKTPTNPPLLRTKADLLTFDGKSDEALKTIEAAIKADGSSSSAYGLLGDLRQRRREYDAAAAAYGEALRLSPGNVDVQKRLSGVSLALGHAPTSVQLARSAVTAAPRDPQARAALIQSLIGSGNVGEALPHARALALAEPNQPGPQVLLGNVLALQKDWPGARQAFTRALQLAPGNIDAIAGLSGVDIATGATTAGVARVETALRARPDDGDTLMLAAQTYTAAKDLGKAETTLRKLIEVRPSEFRAYLMLAQTYVSRGQLDAALTQYDAMIQKQPKSVAALTMAALIVEAQGRRDEAIKRYESVLAIDERAPVAANNLAFHLADSGKNLDKALQLAQAAIAAAPEAATVNDTLGWVYYKKNLQALAVQSFEKALKAEPNNAVFHYHLGAAYAAAGDKLKARQSLSRAIDLKLGSEDAARAKSMLASLRS